MREGTNARTIFSSITAETHADCISLPKHYTHEVWPPRVCESDLKSTAGGFECHHFYLHELTTYLLEQSTSFAMRPQTIAEHLQAPAEDSAFPACVNHRPAPRH